MIPTRCPAWYVHAARAQEAHGAGLPRREGVPAPSRAEGLLVNLLYVFIPAAAVAGLVQTSLFEWVYHRYWLHRPWLPPQMFTAHTLVHHQLCKHEDTFHVTEEEQEEALTFQWWAGPVLIAINLIPWALVAWWQWDRGLPWVPALSTMAGVMLLYYFAYEGFHYLMHKPAIPWIERTRVFGFLKQLHQLHHIYMGKNFNVVLPLADLWLGTLVLANPHPARATEPAAKQVARRHSRWGRRLREDAAERHVARGEPLPPLTGEEAAAPPES